MDESKINDTRRNFIRDEARDESKINDTRRNFIRDDARDEMAEVRARMSQDLNHFEGQKPRLICAHDVKGRKRGDYFAPFLFQAGCLVATVSSGALVFAVQERNLFQRGLTEDMDGAGFPSSSYDFTEADTNVEKEGYVAPEGMVFVAKSMGVLAGVPFIDNANSEDYPEWIDEYAPKAIEVLLANARVAIYPNGEKNGEFSLGSLMLNPSQRGITSGASLPQVIQSIGGLPVPIDGELELTNKDTVVKLKLPRAKRIPARATSAAATTHFPFYLVFEGRAQPIR